MFTVFSKHFKPLKHLAVIASTLILSNCVELEMGTGTASGPKIDTSKPVPVALLIPKSNPQAGPVAASLEKAAMMAVADLGGSAKIDLRVYDTAGNAGQAATVARQAVADGAKIILGPLYAEAANAAAVAVKDQNVNVLSFSNNATIAGGNLFVLGPTFNNTASRLISFAASQGKRRAVVVHPENVEGQLGRNAFQTAASGSQLQIVGTTGFAFSQEGVIAAIPRVKSTVAASGADTLFITSNSAGALPILAQLLPEAGVSPASIQYAGLARWDVPPQTLELSGLQGGWFTLPDQGMITNFEARYQAYAGTGPHQLAGLAYDGIAAIGALVAQGKSDALSAAALTQSSGFQGVSGVFRLKADGTNERALAIAQVRDRKVVIIDQAPRSFAFGAGF